MLWKRCSRLYIKRTGDDVCFGRGCCRVVFGAIGVAIGVGSALCCVGGVVFEGWRFFDGVDNSVGGVRDATVAYEGRVGETRRREKGSSGLLGVTFGRAGGAAAFSDGFCSCDACDGVGDCDVSLGIARRKLAKMPM